MGNQTDFVFCFVYRRVQVRGPGGVSTTRGALRGQAQHLAHRRRPRLVRRRRDREGHDGRARLHEQGVRAAYAVPAASDCPRVQPAENAARAQVIPGHPSKRQDDADAIV